MQSTSFEHFPCRLSRPQTHWSTVEVLDADLTIKHVMEGEILL